MENPKYNQPEYEEYPEYPGLGLPASQLALIIGVNAVISLIISVGVVLLINWQVAPTVALPTATQTSGLPVAIEPTLPISVAVTTSPNAPESLIYKVQSGDSLSRIADKFKVPVKDLMVANGLSNEDFIQVDQELIIPVGGLPTATPTFTAIPPTPTEAIPFDPPTALPPEATVPPEPVMQPQMTTTPSPNPLPTTTKSAPILPPTPIITATAPSFNGIVITINDVAAPGNLEEERLSITNLGTGTSLKGWTLEGSAIGVFSFPDIFIFSGGTIRIHTKVGQSTPSDLYLSQTRAAWPSKTVVTLRDDKKIEVSTFTIP